MSTTAVAILVASISAGVALISAGLSVVSAVAVERVRRRGNREVERLKDELARQAKADDRRVQTAELVRTYQYPLLRSAYDLQSRIYNVIRGGFRGRRDERDYFVSYTLYVIAEFFGWLEIVRREVQFLDLAVEQDTAMLKDRLDRIQGRLASTGRRHPGDFYVYRGQQRAIGELMIVESADGPRGAGRSTCLGYAAFVERMDQPSFAPWIAHLRERIEDLTDADIARLAEVQNELIDLVDQLDPDRVRFATNREKLQVPSGDA